MSRGVGVSELEHRQNFTSRSNRSQFVLVDKMNSPKASVNSMEIKLNSITHRAAKPS